MSMKAYIYQVWKSSEGIQNQEFPTVHKILLFIAMGYQFKKCSFKTELCRTLPRFSNQIWHCYLVISIQKDIIILTKPSILISHLSFWQILFSFSVPTLSSNQFIQILYLELTLYCRKVVNTTKNYTKRLHFDLTCDVTESQQSLVAL